MAKKNEAALETEITVKAVRTLLRSTSVYSQGKVLQSKQIANESYDDMEERCWRERCHTTPEGNIFIPPMAFKNALVGAAKLLKERIPGKKNQEYGKQFECGVIVVQGIDLPISVQDVKRERLFVPSDGRRGGGSRVYRIFPLIESWEGWVEWYVTSPAITKPVFRKYVDAAGLMIGIGRFRVERGGYYGRFELVEMEWPE